MTPSWDRFETVFTFDNLFQAHARARRGKTATREVIRFEADLGANLVRLQTQLLDGSYTMLPYRHFSIRDPKPRVIDAPSYRDRVVQHCLCEEVLRPALEPRLIFDNAACRVGKGTHFALDRVKGFLRDHVREYGLEGWILKFDVRHYFASIDHGVLRTMLRRVFRNRELLSLMDGVINSLHCRRGVGLPLGNLTSQWFALYYLDGLDRRIKEKWQMPRYSRYMDDGVVIDPSLEHLRDCLADLRVYVRDTLGLELNSKTSISPIAQGVKYLGFHSYVDPQGAVIRKVNRATKTRMRRRLKVLGLEYQRGEATSNDVAQRVRSYVAHLSHGQTRALRTNVLENIVFQHERVVGSDVRDTPTNSLALAGSLPLISPDCPM